MPERNEQELAEIRLDDPKDPPDGGLTPPPNNPEVQTGPPRGDDDLR